MTTPKKKGISGEISGPCLVEQGHGGALLTGGAKGHRGGSGRPPSAIREHCRGSFAERVKVLEQIADGELPNTNVSPNDRTRAIDLLGKYGAVDKIALTVEEQPETEMTPERIAGLWERLQRIQSVEQLEKMLVATARKQLGE